MPQSRFTLMAYANKESWPAIHPTDLYEWRQVVAAAENLLERGGYQRVEVWSNGEAVEAITPRARTSGSGLAAAASSTPGSSNS